MTKRSLYLGLAFCSSLLVVTVVGGCANAVDEEEDLEAEPVDDGNTDEQGLYDCSERGDTGYSHGNAFAIQVVSVDGKDVEVETANAYLVMQDAAARDGVGLRIVSGFRTMAQQQYLYGCYIHGNCNGGNLAARPGYSNHQSGHALDLNTSDPGVAGWLGAHGGAFGFSRTVPSEAWHFEWWGGGPGGGPCGQPQGPPPPAPTGCGILDPGQGLGQGQSTSSCSGQFTLVHQGDGNVVLYQAGGHALWSSATNGVGTDVVVMQGDGNFVLYKPGGVAAWSTRTSGHAGAYLVVQDDGNLVIYSAWRAPLWASGTHGTARLRRLRRLRRLLRRRRRRRHRRRRRAGSAEFSRPARSSRRARM